MKEIDIRTDRGMSVREKWEHGPHTYLGIMIAGFPNLFMITGPQSPGVKKSDDIGLRAARRLDRGLHAVPERLWLLAYRGGGGCRGRLGAAQQRGGRSYTLSVGEILGRRRQYPGETPCVHAVCRRHRRIQEDM